MKDRDSNYSRVHAQSIVEVIVGCLVLVPIALFLLDLIVLVLANSVNDGLVKNAARSAANQSTKENAAAAVKKIKDDFGDKNPIVTLESLDLEPPTYDPTQDQTVTVKSKIKVKLPVPVPGLDPTPKFEATATEANVSVQ